MFESIRRRNTLYLASVCERYTLPTPNTRGHPTEWNSERPWQEVTPAVTGSHPKVILEWNTSIHKHRMQLYSLTMKSLPSHKKCHTWRPDTITHNMLIPMEHLQIHAICTPQMLLILMTRLAEFIARLASQTCIKLTEHQHPRPLCRRGHREYSTCCVIQSCQHYKFQA